MTEFLNIILPWMAEHWLLTITLAFFLCGWRPLTLVDARSDSNTKVKVRPQKQEDK